jgi:hypothetical protein
MDATRAGDLFEEAVAAAQDAAGRLGLGARDSTVLHRSHNVVVRINHVVLKVGTDHARIRREVEVSRDAARAGGPVLTPHADALEVGRFLVSAWPYLRVDSAAAGDEAAARALRELHRALGQTRVLLPRLADRFDEVRRLLDDERVTGALDGEGRVCLRAALDRVSAAVAESPAELALHTEPHDGNRLTVGGVVVYIDLEAVCIGPVEWDLAYLPDAVAEEVWPDHDRRLRRRLHVGVSACVSTYCWRHVTSRPGDSEMRWHAEHHLGFVRDALAKDG